MQLVVQQADQGQGPRQRAAERGAPGGGWRLQWKLLHHCLGWQREGHGEWQLCLPNQKIALSVWDFQERAASWLGLHDWAAFSLQ